MPDRASEIGDRIRREIANAAKALTLEIDKELRRTTPVDTGHARRNWVPSVTEPFAGVATSEDAHTAGVTEVIGYTLEAGPLWVANNVPYIRRLNYGHSKQAPAGFIERAVDIALQRVQQRYRGRVDLTDMRSRVQSEIGARAAENLASAYSPFGGDE